MSKSTIQYLIDNDLTPDTGLLFTCNDYDFINKNKLDKIIINEGKPVREETLNQDEILIRIKELYLFVTKFAGKTIHSQLDNNSIKERILIPNGLI